MHHGRRRARAGQYRCTDGAGAGGEAKRLTVRKSRLCRQRQWKGASGYGIQGMAGGFITAINGSYTAIVGLPLYETRMLLQGMGWRG